LPENVAEIIRDPITLSTWFMDDGNIIKRNGKTYGYYLNTQSFSKEENNSISQALNKVHGIENLLEKNHGRYRIRIMKKESRSKFQDIIGKYMLPAMRYKLG